MMHVLCAPAALVIRPVSFLCARLGGYAQTVAVQLETHLREFALVIQSLASLCIFQGGLPRHLQYS